MDIFREDPEFLKVFIDTFSMEGYVTDDFSWIEVVFSREIIMVIMHEFNHKPYSITQENFLNVLI
ncbi:hypothetical protein ES703_117153 [subsurface metagenome]